VYTSSNAPPRRLEGGVNISATSFFRPAHLEPRNSFPGKLSKSCGRASRSRSIRFVLRGVIGTSGQKRNRFGWHISRCTYVAILKATVRTRRFGQKLTRHAIISVTRNIHAPAISPSKRDAQSRAESRPGPSPTGSHLLVLPLVHPLLLAHRPIAILLHAKLRPTWA
jgi:hypothetical protein